MAVVKFTGEEALGRVADYVNKKLAFASSMPESPDTNAVVMYIGTTTSDYRLGSIYQFDGTNWVCINSSIMAVEISQAEYDALPQAVQLNGNVYFITDAGTDDGTELVQGYYNPADGKFYEESTYTTEITPSVDCIYIDLTGNKLYRYSSINTKYFMISGGSADNIVWAYYNSEDGKFYEDSSYITEITPNAENIYIDLGDNKIYRYDTTDTEYIIIGGGGESSGGTIEGYYNNEDGKFYQEETFITEIPGQAGMLYVDLSENKTYRYDESETKFIVVGGDNTEYQAGIGIDITNGVISGDYTAGHGISINNGVISDKTFVGTTAQWETLTPAQQSAYEERVLTDDEPNIQQKTNGHTIKDEDGVSKTQRSSLQFEGLDVADDDVNDKTIVAPTTLKEEIYNVIGQKGAKNLIPYPYYHTTRTENGVTFTDNGDGTITVNGTATADTYFVLSLRNSDNGLNLKTGKYLLTGCPIGGDRTIYQLYIINFNNTETLARDTGDGFSLTLTSDKSKCGCLIRISNGITVSNLVFKPMLRLASDTDNTYQSYAMTNKELTEKIANTYQFVEDILISTDSSSFATCMTDIVDLLLDYQSTCSSNEFFKIQTVNCGGLQMTLQLPIDIWPTTDLPSMALAFSSTVIHANDLQIHAVRNNVTDGVHRYTLDNTTLTWTHTVLNSTNAIRVAIRVYKYRKV